MHQDFAFKDLKIYVVEFLVLPAYNNRKKKEYSENIQMV